MKINPEVIAEDDRQFSEELANEVTSIVVVVPRNKPIGTYRAAAI